MEEQDFVDQNLNKGDMADTLTEVSEKRGLIGRLAAPRAVSSPLPWWSWAVLLLVLNQVYCGWVWNRIGWWTAGWILMAISTAWLLWRRRNLRFLVASLGITLLMAHGIETWFAYRHPSYVQRTLANGNVPDTRSFFDLWDEQRAAGQPGVPAIMPSAAYAIRHQPLKINGRDAVALNSFSRIRTHLCSELGPWTYYQSDEHGFNNPMGIWGQPLQVGIVGDSFTHATCVERENSPAGIIRSSFPKTINLAMGANGPLLELAAIKEYLAPYKPEVVVQFVYENDITNGAEESTYPELQPYLNERNYRVGLLENQAAIEDWLRVILSRQSEEARRWPKLLSGIGLTRATTPFWIQDLVMGEDLTSTAQVLRLHKLYELGKARIFGRDPVSKPAGKIDGFAVFRKTIAEAQATVSGWNGKYYLVFLPGYSAVKGHPASIATRDFVLETGRELNVPVFDALEILQKNEDPLARYFAFAYGHYNAEGYRVVGDQVAQWLKQQRTLAISSNPSQP
jgi:hypothetical protein